MTTKNKAPSTSKFSADKALMEITDQLPLFKDEYGNTYTEVDTSKGNIQFCSTDSSELHNHISERYIELSEVFPPEKKVYQAIQRLEGKAKRDGKLVQVGLRYGVINENID